MLINRQTLDSILAISTASYVQHNADTGVSHDQSHVTWPTI